MLAYTGVFFWLSYVKASNFDAENSDLGHMWQSVWNVAHGHGFVFTLTGDTVNIPRLAVHADYFLVLLAPFSWLWPHYTMMLFVQALMVAAGAWFVERIARRWTGHAGVSLAFALAYLLNGPLQFALLWQFHAVTVATTFVLAAVEAIVNRRRSWVVWLWFVLALSTKEQVGYIAGPLLMIVAWWSDRRRLGWTLAGIGWAYSLVHFLFIIPAFRDSGNSHFVWEFYYGSLGTTLPEQVRHLLTWPELTARLWRGLIVQNIWLSVLPLALLPLLEPLSLLGLIAMLPHWVSDRGTQENLLRINHVLMTTVFFVAAIRAGQKILQRRWVSPKILAAVVLGFSLIGTVVISPFPWSVYLDPNARHYDPAVAMMQTWHKKIPRTAVVGYSHGASAEWRDREYAFLLPAAMDRIEYAIVFVTRQEIITKNGQARADRLNRWLRSTTAFTALYTDDQLAVYQRDRTVPLPATRPDINLDHPEVQ